MPRFLLSALLLGALAAAAAADKVVLNDGREYEGLVVEDSDKLVRIKTAKATLSFPRSQVKSVEKGNSALAERESRLEALDPENLKGYLEAAEWFVGPGKPAADLATMRRLCNIASRDRALAGRAQAILGDVLLDAGDRVNAARAYQRAAAADPSQTAAKQRAAELKTELEESAMKDLAELSAVIKLVIESQYAEALPRLRKTRGLYFAEHANPVLRMSLQQLADDLQSRVPCKACGGRAALPCKGCDAKGLLECHACGGKGIRKNYVPKGQDDFADKVCKTCLGLGTLLCTECKAERRVTVLFVPDAATRRGSVDVETSAGKERAQIGAEVNLGRWELAKGGNKVTGMSPQPVMKGSTKPCATCRGIAFAPPATPPDINALTEYRNMIEARRSGKEPLDLADTGGGFSDEAYLEDGGVRYRGGKWVE